MFRLKAFFLASLFLFLAQTALAQPCPLANPVVVTTTSNAAGQTNLQWACNCVNTVPVLNQITFSIPGAGPHTIQPNVAFPIPVLTKNNLQIDGTTDNIILDGSVAGNVPGLDVFASEATVEGLEIQNFQQAGIVVRLGGNHTLSNNNLHDNQFGINALSNVQNLTATQNVIQDNLFHGIFLQGSTTTATISTNGISGNNGSGVFAPGIGNVLVTSSNFWCNLENGISRGGGAPAPPVISQASNSQISGTAPPNASVEVFVEDNAACTSAPCQGRFFVGTTTATAAGSWTLALSPGDVSPGDAVAATATTGNVNTSEFSTACVTVLLDCSTFNTTATETGVSCFGGANGSATANPTGGTTPYTFAWDNGGTTQTITNLTAGTYFVTVTDALTCIATASANVSQPVSAPTATVIETDVFCFGASTGAIDLTPGGGTPGYTFDWADLPGTNNPEDRSNLPAGNYSVTVTDANGCIAVATTTITQPTQISPAISVGNVSCNGGANGSINLSVSGGTPGYTFDWADLPGAINSEDRLNLPAGTYSVTISDANACTETAAATVSEPNAISSSTSVTNIACGGGSTGGIDLSVGGGTPPFSFDWADLPGTNDPEDRSNLSAGTYSVTISDANACTETAIATVGQNSTLNLTGTTAPPFCNGDATGSINLTPGGGAPPFTFDWSDLPGANDPEDRSNLLAGTYSVTVTDANACSADTTFNLDEPPGLSGGGLIANVLCNGDANGGVNLVINGGTFPYTYDWADIPGDDDPEDRGDLATGLYSFTVTDANGCTFSGGSFINEPPPLVPGLTATGETSPGASDGTATGNPSGGTPPYDFLWSNGATAAQISNLVPGDYSVTITDFNGCTIADTIALPMAGCNLSVSISSMPATCFQSATGSLSATATGDMPPFNFSWSNGETTASIDSLAVGQYSVIVTDAANCTATATAAVTQPGALPLPVYAVFAPDTVCGNTTFTLEADDLFPSAAVAYVWRLPTDDTLLTTAPDLDVTALSTAFSGEYFVARDSAGCRSQWVGGAPVEVVSLAPGAAFAGNDSLLCNPAQIQLAAVPPPVGVGEWRSLSGDDISQPNSSTTNVQISEAGEHAFVWQIAVAQCPQAAIDTVIFFVEAPSLLKDDAWTLKRAHDELVMNVLLNDNLSGLQDTVLTQLDSPVSGDLEFLPEQRQFRYTAAEGFRGTVQFHYVVCNPLATCGVGCDTALVTIEVLNLPTVPEALVIDDPGLNGELTIAGIQGLRVELSIFNRWGDLVYQVNEYKNENPWRGHFQRTGQVLPHGAYFFFLNAFEKEVRLGETQTGVIHLFGK